MNIENQLTQKFDLWKKKYIKTRFYIESLRRKKGRGREKHISLQFRMKVGTLLPS